jgi:hypothetical protein
MNFYMNVGPQYMEPIARQLHQQIVLIEEEHVTHDESLVDPVRPGGSSCSAVSTTSATCTSRSYSWNPIRR